MRRLLIALLWLCVGPVPADAVPNGTCDFHSVTSPRFGEYDPLSSIRTTTTGQISYQCNKTPPIRIRISAGNSGSYAQRKMRGPASDLGYNLYLDAANTQIWGDGTGGSSVYGPVEVNNDAPVTVTMYGTIPPRQSAGAGSYTDVLVVTIDF
ncbi:MAG: spore coat protein U domain-containing protein [Candidatus Eremiobacteraeota bacterium]|nr:spore coat protein U domain-containing protein [Candidatus Eremiobacteraeota bacterium]